jgi:uncharacterized protein (DUF1330 family)
MVAYAIIEAEIRDLTAFIEYLAIATPVIQDYGGRYLAEGKDAFAVETAAPNNVYFFVIQFPSIERLKQCYASSDYAPALCIMPGALEQRLIAVDGTRSAPQ